MLYNAHVMQFPLMTCKTWCRL